MNVRPLKLMFAMSLYEINGSCAVAKNLIDNLDRQKFCISLIAERIAERHFELAPDVKIIDLGLEASRGIVNKISNIINHIRKIKAVINAEHPDIILGFGTIINCYILLSLNRNERKKLKVILTEHSELFFNKYTLPDARYKLLKKIYKLMMFIFYRKADCIIAVSRNIADSLNRLLSVKDKVKVIYNPVNTRLIRKLSEEEITNFDFDKAIPYIAVVSRLSPEKGISRLIEAFADLIRQLDARLIIIGDGQERNKLEALTTRHGIKDKIKFVGWQKNPFKYLKNTQLFILPSIYEGFPNVILEAMACGIPVVTFKSGGGIEEIIDDGINGILINPRNPAILSDTIYNLLLDRALREKIINEAYKKIDRFDVSNIVKEYESTMMELVSTN